MTRRQRRKIATIVLLVLLLLLLGSYYAYYRSTNSLHLDFAPTTSESVPVPDYLFSFAGPIDAPLLRPIGISVDGNSVWVTDSQQAKIYVFDSAGKFLRSFSNPKMVVPLYVAKHPKTGEYYVSDRRTRSVHVFSPAGKLVREFDPKLPEDQLPGFATGGVQWAPVALAFASDGSLFVTEILNGHRVLKFDPSGKFVASVGTAGFANDARANDGVFQFPNSVKVRNGEVWVVDSNNRRIQVFDDNLQFKRIIVTDGLPRGMDFLGRFRSDEGTGTERFVSVDTLAHDVTIWSTKGSRIVSFGQNGVLEGEFNYPNDVAVGSSNLIFITDSANGRVQVWGWPQEASPVPIPAMPAYWRWCFAPLLLLPLLLVLRKRKYFATADFVSAMLEAQQVSSMPGRRRRWLVEAETYEMFSEMEQDGIDLSELLHVVEHSASDADALRERLGVDQRAAEELSIAARAYAYCVEDPEMRRVARLLEIEHLNHLEFIERYSKSGSKGD